jgi:hypothetical protein
VRAVIREAVTPVVVIPEEGIRLAEAVDAAKAARAEAVVDAVKEDPVGRVAVQVDRAAASASISARRRFASFVSRRWT